MGKNKRKNQGVDAHSHIHSNALKPTPIQSASINTGREAPMTREAGANVVAPAAPVAASPGGLQTMQQRRARYALEQVGAALDPQRTGATFTGKEFKSQASSFPAMIQVNGLGQAAAYHFSQGKAHLALYELLSRWLTKPDQPYAGCQNLLAGITQRDMHSYFVAQAEALLLLDWVKRFVKAEVRED